MIDRIFTQLALEYGQRFTNHWPVDMVPAAKEAWNRELVGITPEAIEWALNHLPTGNPPMAPDFRELCRQYPAPSRVSRVRVAQTPEERERALEILRAFDRPGRQDPRDWARRLRAREMAGERLTKFQRECWREALSSGEKSE